MLTKNLTPYLFGTKVTSRRPPQAEMMVIVRATYELHPDGALTVVRDLIAQRPLSAETYAEGDDDRAGECLYPSDFADFKLNAEVMFKGHCHVAGGKPLSECLVRFGVGPWSKTLRVVGRRAWSDSLPGALASAPLPFTKMPITWASAFGGPGFLKNPAGKGLGAELPTVELPNLRVTSRADRPEPAGLGPINPAWPPRAGKLGREYGKAWRDKRAPFYAEDLDWTHFHAAPLDQQMEGYLRGDEELLFQNLHPTSPTLQSRLPGARVRVFVHDDGDRFREVPMSIDTLVADLDRGVVEIGFRGLVAVRERDLEDIRTMLVAEERIGDRRLPEEHYRDILLAFEKDPVGLSTAMPPGFADVVERAEAERKGELPPPREGLDPISGRLDQKLGKFGEETTRKVAEAIALAKDKAGPHRDIGPELEALAQAMDDSPPPVRVIKPGSMPPLRLRSAMRSLLEQTAGARKTIEGKDIPAAEREKIEAKLAEADAVPHDPRWKQLDPGYRPPIEPISTEEPGPGRDLSEQDLSRRDLRNLDLRGANLEGAILTRADLSGADLTGASLRDAVLYRANLTGARLAKADLWRANLARAIAREADFTGADLRLCFLEDADLGGAVLVEVEGAYAVLKRADLRGVKAARACFDHAEFDDAALDAASFEGASLVAARLARARGRGASLTRARIGGASFQEADFSRASFADTTGEKAIFEKATLEGADFSHADLPSSHFTKASAAGASLLRANLPWCRFYKARLDRVDATEANLFQADLSYARLSRIKLTRASLFEAAFTGAAGEGADFTDANLKRTTLERDA